MKKFLVLGAFALLVPLLSAGEGNHPPPKPMSMDDCRVQCAMKHQECFQVCLPPDADKPENKKKAQSCIMKCAEKVKSCHSSCVANQKKGKKESQD